jgi:hypothetical protein
MDYEVHWWIHIRGYGMLTYACLKIGIIWPVETVRWNVECLVVYILGRCFRMQ